MQQWWLIIWTRQLNVIKKYETKSSGMSLGSRKQVKRRKDTAEFKTLLTTFVESLLVHRRHNYHKLSRFSFSSSLLSLNLPTFLVHFSAAAITAPSWTGENTQMLPANQRNLLHWRNTVSYNELWVFTRNADEQTYYTCYILMDYSIIKGGKSSSVFKNYQ